MKQKEKGRFGEALWAEGPHSLNRYYLWGISVVAVWRSLLKITATGRRL